MGSFDPVQPVPGDPRRETERPEEVPKAVLEIACPSCGSPVRFRAESSVYATCEACSSLLVRHDVDVEAIGKVADLQPDGSPIQIGTSGVFDGAAFEVLGRIQVRYDQGFWNEWHLQFQDGRTGWLGEALGEYFVSFRVDFEGALPRPDTLEVGTELKLGGERFVVTTLAYAQATSFEGELPFVQSTEYALPYADLRTATRQAATLDYSEEDHPLLFLGGYRTFQELQLQGLRDPDEEPPRRTAKATRVLRCPSCGAPHELHAASRSQTLVCQFCESAIDLTDPTFKLLWKAKQQRKIEPDIPLNARGRLDGVEWENLGFQRRFVVVEGARYFWSEYLLYRRDMGYRYLTESQGHWSLLAPMAELPRASDGGPVHGWPPQDFVRVDGRKFDHFQSAKASTDYVLGEFPWRVSVEDEAGVHDYVAPPEILSAEVGPDGVVWSRGRYLLPQEVWEAFVLPGAPPAQIGVAPNQPSPFAASMRSAWTWYALLVLLGFVMMMGFAMTARAQRVFQQTYAVETNQEPSVISTPFRLEGRTANVEVRINTDLGNRWAFFEMALLNEKTNEALNFSKGVSYYYGSDWSEGSQQETVLVPSVPPGTYLLRIEPQTGTADAPDRLEPDPKAPGAPKQKLLTYTVTVVRDVPQWKWYWMLVAVMLLYPLFAWMRNAGFEKRRWTESDHPPGES